MIYPRLYWWRRRLKSELNKPYVDRLYKFIQSEKKKGKIIYPQETEWFRALNLCSGTKIKAVILGQDPYANGTADGLAFSATTITPSLRNIFRCLKSDIGIVNENTTLEEWAKQGVLLLNTVFTVEQDKPLSHKGIGWEKITNKIIEIIDKDCKPLIWCLWGNEAKSKKNLIKNKKSVIIESSHCSPHSAHRGFLWHKPFSKINEFCRKNKRKEINWKT